MEENLWLNSHEAGGRGCSDFDVSWDMGISPEADLLLLPASIPVHLGLNLHGTLRTHYVYILFEDKSEHNVRELAELPLLYSLPAALCHDRVLPPLCPEASMPTPQTPVTSAAEHINGRSQTGWLGLHDCSCRDLRAGSFPKVPCKYWDDFTAANTHL